jgi:hypothetical protein
MSSGASIAGGVGCGGDGCCVVGYDIVGCGGCFCVIAHLGCIGVDLKKLSFSFCESLFRCNLVYHSIVFVIVLTV